MTDQQRRTGWTEQYAGLGKAQAGTISIRALQSLPCKAQLSGSLSVREFPRSTCSTIQSRPTSELRRFILLPKIFAHLNVCNGACGSQQGGPLLQLLFKLAKWGWLAG